MRAKKFHVQRPSTPGHVAKGQGHFGWHAMPSVFRLFRPTDAWSYPTFLPPLLSELFDTDSESDPAHSQHMPGASKPPRPPKRPTVACVQDLSEASLGSFVCRDDVRALTWVKRPPSERRGFIPFAFA